MAIARYPVSVGIFLCLLGAQLIHAANQPESPRFGPQWKALLGNWESEPGPGSSGVCGFHFDLAEHVIVRTNLAKLSAGAPVHQDLMILSPEAAPEKACAVYYDNEGHVIDYTAEWSGDGNTLTLTSKSGPGAQFRLKYTKAGTDAFNVTFEFAPPGQPGAYKTYTSGKIKRTN